MDRAVWQGFVKWAADESKTHRAVGNYLLDRDVPILPRLPADAEKARELLRANIRAATSDRWTHPQVAVRKLPLAQLGFKPTRLAIPLPGESLGTTSYRSGELHAHKMGPYYLVHEDGKAPEGVVGVARHVVEDGLPALGRRMFEDLPAPVISRRR